MTAPNIGALSIPAQLVLDRCARNTYYRAAVQTPQLVEAVELRDRALRARAELPPITPVLLPTTADADLDEWLNLVAHVAELDRGRAARDDALGRLVAAQDKTISSIAANQDPILARLNVAMAGVMDIAAAIVARLNGASNAAQIVAAGDPDALAAYQDLRRLRVDEYDAIRTAQDWTLAGDRRVLHYRSNWLHDDDLATDTAIANLDELFPQWRDRNAGVVLISDQPQADPRPWPTDPTEQMVWLVTSGAKVWVPTWAQLGELGRQRMNARAHNNHTGSRPRKQRDQRPTKTNRPSELLNEQLEVTA